MIKAITAFTVAHCITLAAAALGFVRVPPKPVEAAIALSIAFVALEIVRARDGDTGIAARGPWLVAFAFGLLHGFGFAGALSEIGLPAAHIPAALLFFNVGVEIGQLLFCRRGVEPRRARPPRPATLAALGRSCATLPHRKRGHVLGDPARVCFLNGGTNERFIYR